jgi:hypothetical protein
VEEGQYGYWLSVQIVGEEAFVEKHTWLVELVGPVRELSMTSTHRLEDR